MSSPDPSEAKRLSRDVSYIPFGVRGLDSDVRGVPTGSSVLLAGAPDAGGDAFTYTSLARLMLARHRPDEVSHTLADRAEDVPDGVTYVTLSHDREHVYSEMDAVLDDRQFETLVEHLTIADFPQRFMDLLPVPDALYHARRRTSDIESPKADEPPDEAVDEDTFNEFLEDVSETLAASSDDLLVVDSVADLERATEFGLTRAHEHAFLLGLRDAVVNWGSVAYVKHDRRAAEVRTDPAIHGLLHGHVYFYSNDEGYTTYRTVRVGSFGGALDAKRQIVFDSIIDDDGFRAKATKKIGRSKW